MRHDPIASRQTARARPVESAHTFSSLLALGQGIYFVVTGIWPLLSMRTFVAITGPKTDLWLVKTVGLMITAVGAALLKDGLEQRADDRSAQLAIASAGALAAVDINYALRRRISLIYLLDAVAELALIALWLLARFSPSTRRVSISLHEAYE